MKNLPLIVLVVTSVLTLPSISFGQCSGGSCGSRIAAVPRAAGRLLTNVRPLRIFRLFGHR